MKKFNEAAERNYELRETNAHQMRHIKKEIIIRTEPDLLV